MQSEKKTSPVYQTKLVKKIISTGGIITHETNHCQLLPACLIGRGKARKHIRIGKSGL